MRLYKALLIIVLLALSSQAQAFTLNEKAYKKLNCVKSFNKQPTGSIAFLPKAGSTRVLDWVRTIHLLPESGLYSLRRKSNYFFRVNHYSDSEEGTYLGVIAYLIYEGEYNHRPPLNLTRNKANWRAGPNRSLQNKRTGPSNTKIDVGKYIQAHNAGTLSECDSILSFTWHASTENEKYNTWDYRTKWGNPVPPMLDNFLIKMNIDKQNFKSAITAHIINFRTSPDPSSYLDFYFNADQASGVYLQVFSPLSVDFDKEFYFIFK
jgi:hypothetical protein